MPNKLPDDAAFLTPREVAEIFGVRTTTIARWAREGRLPAFLTPGGHRRYRREDVRQLLDEQEQGTALEEAARPLPEDAARLYDEGWSIRQIAEKFNYSYSAMRRILRKHVILRNRGATYANIYHEDRA
jgi:excisionase family DNA binding protein